VECFDPGFTVMEKEEEANFLREDLSPVEKRLEDLKK